MKASEVLRISQPALSKALKLLEDEVGLKLLERDGRGLRLTQDGKKFKSSAEPLLNEWLAMPSQLKERSCKQSLRVGSFEVFTTYFIGHLLNQIKLPEFELHEFTPGRLEDALGDGSIDIGITYHPISRSGVKFTEVTKIRMGIFGAEVFRKTAFNDLPFVIPNDLVEGTPSKVMGLDGWPDHRFPRKLMFKVTLMESALELCRQRRAVAYLPDFIVRLHNSQVKKEYELQELSCPIPTNNRLQSVFLVQTSSDFETPFIRSLAKALRSL